MRPRVVEVERHSTPKRAPQRQGHAVIGRLAGIHPGRHGAALDVEKRIASCDGQALTFNVRAGGIAIQRMETVEVAAVVVAVAALEIIRRRTSREHSILETRPQILDERKSRHDARILLHCGRRQSGIIERAHLRIVLLPGDSRFRFLEILQRSEDITLQQQPV